MGLAYHSRLIPSYSSTVGMCILYNWDLFINNGNIMARPHYLLLSSARDGPTNSSQSESQDFWGFVQILHPSLLSICTYSTISTINIINNYPYVNMGTNNANSVHGKSKIRKEFSIVPATATSKYNLQCNWCAEPPSQTISPNTRNLTSESVRHIRERKTS
jgi:hypothetical protein